MIHEEQLDMVDRLVQAGVRATADPRRVDPPCVIVVPTNVDFDSLCIGQGTTEWSLNVLAPPPGGRDAMVQLSRAAAVVVDTIQGIDSGSLTSYSTDTGDSWPCISFQLRTVSQWN